MKLLAAGIRYPRLINRASATLFYHSTVSIAFSFYRTYIEKPSANRRARVELFISRGTVETFSRRPRKIFAVDAADLAEQVITLVPGERINLGVGSMLFNIFFFIFSSSFFLNMMEE